jgi:hypothetical protein
MSDGDKGNGYGDGNGNDVGNGYIDKAVRQQSGQGQGG